MTPPRISVVVPTEGRETAVGSLVASLRTSRELYERSAGSAAESVELIVVDSTVPPLDVRAMPAWDDTWMSITPGTTNVRQKRNQGVAEARGEWIAFIDSDCVASAEYFTAIFSAIARPEARAFAGRVKFRGSENAMWRVVAASQLITPETQTAGEGDTPWCATANLIVERKFFLTLGGFDESLPFRLGGDDVDLGLRLHAAGSALRVLPNALVIHPKEPWSHLRAIVPRAWRWGRVEYHLALRHGDKVRPMPPFFMATALSLAIVCCVAAALARRPALLLMIPAWLLVSTLLATEFTNGSSDVPFFRRYAASWLDRVYHVGAATEAVRHGSWRFLWQGLVLVSDVDDLFPAEPLLAWANVVAVLLIGIVGVLIVRA